MTRQVFVITALGPSGPAGPGEVLVTHAVRPSRYRFDRRRPPEPSMGPQVADWITEHMPDVDLTEHQRRWLDHLYGKGYGKGGAR